MTTLREAAQQALDALYDIDATGVPVGHIDAVIDTLKTALEQPNKDYERGFVDGMSEQARRSVDRAVNALAQQEPVAWGLFAETDGEWQLQYPVFVGECGKRNAEAEAEAAACNSPYPIEVRPLYTHPPRREWRGLTEKDIGVIALQSLDGISPYDDAQRFARAIEQALKERNNG